MGKPRSPHLLILECSAGGGNEAIHGRFVNHRVLLIAFALDSPEIAFMRQGNQIYTSISASQIQFSWKFIPEPDGLEQESVLGVRFQVCLHQALESVAFVAFGEGDFAILLEDNIELAHRD